MRALLLLLLLALPVVQVGDGSGTKGSFVKVPIEVAEASHIGSMDIALAYDPSVLRAVWVGKGDLTANALLQGNAKPPGRVLIAMADPGGITGNGSIAMVEFEVLGEAGARSALAFTDLEASGVDAMAVPLANRTGTFTVAETPPPPPEKGVCGPTLVILVATLVLWRRRYA